MANRATAIYPDHYNTVVRFPRGLRGVVQGAGCHRTSHRTLPAATSPGLASRPTSSDVSQLLELMIMPPPPPPLLPLIPEVLMAAGEDEDPLLGVPLWSRWCCRRSAISFS